MDVGVYEGLLDEIALLRDVQVAEEQIARSEGIPHEEVARVIEGLDEILRA